MAGVILTGSQFGISCSERHGIFAWDCRRYPNAFSVVDLNSRNAQILGLRKHGCGAICASLGRNSDNGLVGRGVVENEFEFKPSFDEYVKAMESIKTVREKRRAVKSDRYKSNGDVRSEDGYGEGDGEFEGRLVRKRIHKVMEEDDASDSGDGVNSPEDAVREKTRHKEPRTQELKGNLNGKEHSWGDRVKRMPGGELKSGRWSKYEENNVKSRSERSRITLEKKRTLRDNGSVERLSKREETGVRGNVNNSRFHINPIQEEDIVRDKSRYNDQRTEELRDESDGHESNLGFMVGRVPKGALESERWSKFKKNSVESRLERSHVMLEKQDTYDHPRDKKSINRAFKREEMSVRDNGTSSRFHINPIQVGNVTHRDNKKFTRRGKAFSDKDDNDGLDTERAAFKSFEESTDIMDKPRVSKMEMEERIQKLANGLNGADIHMPEWMFSKMMRSAQIRFSDHSILRIIQLLGKLGNWRRVLQVIEWLQVRERFKSYRLRYVYTAALNVLQKARKPVEALNVFHVMQQQMNTYPDLVAYHSIAITLGQAGHMKELFDVIDSMRSPPTKSFKTGALGKWDPRLEPDIIVYNAVLNACVQRKQWEGAFWVLQQLKQRGLPFSGATYGLVMEVMFVCGKYNLVHEFFRKMQRSFLPNALAYRVLVNTLWSEGKIDEAVLVVQDMERRGIVGSAALYYDFARCLCSAGRCEEALMQIEKICKVASKPLVVTYTGLIQVCLDKGNIQDGSYIFNHMHKFCSPNLVTCNTMLKAYLEHGMFEEAKKLFQQMLENGNYISSQVDYKIRIIPDIYTFNPMLDACVAEKRWDDFEYVYERMLYHGFRFNSRRHLRMILDDSNIRKGELVEMTWKHLAQADQIPPPSLVKERFCMKLEKNDHAAALACITTHRESELPAFSKPAWLNLLKENRGRFEKESLVRLIHELSMYISRSESPNRVFQNLLTSCKEYVRTHLMVTDIDQIDRGT